MDRADRPAARPRAAAEVRGLLALATPLVAGLATSSLMGLIDTAMLGPLGRLPLAAVALTSNALVILVAGLYGFLNPVALRVARAHGERNPRAVAASVAAGLHWARRAGLAAALLMAATLPLLPAFGQPREVVAVVAPYWFASAASLLPLCITLVYKQALDAIDRAWLGVLLSALTLLANAAFNYALIQGRFGLPALGLAGAGLGTLLAYSLGAILHAFACRRTPALRDRFTGAAASATLRAQHRADGVPMGLQYLLEGGAVAVAGVFIGWLGALALAATQVVNAVAGTLYMVPLGMAAAVGIRVAQAAGAREQARLRAIGVAGLLVVSAWMLLATGVLTLAARPIAAAFVADRAVIALAASLFLVIGLMQVLDGIESVSLGALRGLQDVRWPTSVSLVAYWLVAVPLGWLCGFPLGWGAAGVWAGFGLGLAVAATALLRRFLRLTA